MYITMFRKQVRSLIRMKQKYMSSMERGLYLILKMLYSWESVKCLKYNRLAVLLPLSGFVSTTLILTTIPSILIFTSLDTTVSKTGPALIDYVENNNSFLRLICVHVLVREQI